MSKKAEYILANIQEKILGSGKKRFTATIRIKGYPTQCQVFNRKTDAQEWANRLEADIRAGKFSETTALRKKTLADLIRRYEAEVLPYRNSSQKDMQRHLDWWREEIGAYGLISIKPAVLAECRDKLLQKDLKPNGKKKAPATVLRYMATLSHAFSVAVKEWQWLDENPMLKVRKPSLPQGRVRVLSSAEREALLAAVYKSESPYLKAVVVLALSTGARYGEIISLRWSQVDLRKGVILLEKTKNKERRTLHLHSEALRQLKLLKEIPRIDTDLVFPRVDGQEPIVLKKRWEAAVREAGLKDFRFHDLRHTAASYMLEHGAGTVELSAILGHRTLQMVKRYAHLQENRSSEIIKRMNEEIFGA